LYRGAFFQKAEGIIDYDFVFKAKQVDNSTSDPWLDNIDIDFL